MNKDLLHQTIIKALTDIYNVADNATQAAIRTATDKQNIPEHKYDTLSLEAAYLAHGQAQRLQQCLQDIHTFKALPVQVLSDQDAIRAGALIELYDVDNDQNKWFFLSPVAGGVSVEFEGETIHLVTIGSPLGHGLSKRVVGEEFSIHIAGQEKCYEIVSLF